MNNRDQILALLAEVEELFPRDDESVGFTPFSNWRLRVWKAMEAGAAASQADRAALAETVERLEAVLADAIRPSAIKLACGEMTAQEARTAYAVANYVAAKVRKALTPTERGDHA